VQLPQQLGISGADVQHCWRMSHGRASNPPHDLPQHCTFGTQPPIRLGHVAQIALQQALIDVGAIH
jgi:hypothetical protein